MEGQQLIRPQLRDFSGTSTTPSISAGTLNLDLETGNVFEVTLTESVVSLNLFHPPAAGLAASCFLILRQDSSGGGTLVWPSSIRWPGGVQPVVSSANSAVDVFAFFTRDGGATWYGVVGGKDCR
jgi:hypothetical protein